MRNEDKLKLAQQNKQKVEAEKSKASEAQALTAKQRQEEIDSIKQSIENLGKALEVKVDVDLEPLLKKLDAFSTLPDTYKQVKELAEKIHEGLSDKEVSIKGFRDIWEIAVRSNNKIDQNYKQSLSQINETVAKFADLQTYLDQLTQTLQQGQDPQDFRPVRIVVGGDGTKLDFLKAMPSSRGGGGGQTNGLTDEQLRAAPVDVNATLDTTGLSTEAKQDDLIAKIPDQEGTWAYYSGTNGTVNVTGRVLQITAVALGASGSFTIDGGDTITLPYNSTDKASSSITVEPKGNLVDPTIVFDSEIDSFFVEVVT